MGNAQRKNVRERHSRALYVNVPLSKRVAEALLAPSPHVKCATYEDEAWLSIVIDHLTYLESWTQLGYIPMPLSGWMMKANLLVRCTPSGSVEERPSYQIITLDFESSLVGGTIKVLGARATQRIPTEKAFFSMSDGKSGSVREELAADQLYSCRVCSAAGDGDDLLVRVAGTLVPLGEKEKEFARFVMERPNKVLAQDGGKRCVWAPETGDGASFGAEGTFGVVCSELELSTAFIGRLKAHAAQLAAASSLESGELSKADFDMSRAVVLLQPVYNLVDHTNVEL